MHQTQPHHHHHHHSLLNGSSSSSCIEEETEVKQGDQFSLWVSVFRMYMVACKADSEEICSMDIGLPTDVRHVAHVTFDRFNGFLGLPVEFEPEVPRRAPSASAHVFGVSTESMQCSYDSRGNSVPTILLLMQRRMYEQGGLQAEGIFRINADNSQEDHVRDQLNRGVVPEDVEVHSLAGLIKAWFRELPSGVLDPLAPEQVMQCQSEDECVQLVKLLPPTEAALLDWAINLMADVVQEEHHNKMNARNVAMVFAPNMTQMVDPLTALMYAVQVMNFLRTLIERTLRQRKESIIDSSPATRTEPSDENDSHNPSQPCLLEETTQEKENTKHDLIPDEPALESHEHLTKDDDFTAKTKTETRSSRTSLRQAISDTHELLDGDHSCDNPTQVDIVANEPELDVKDPKAKVQAKTRKSRTAQSSNADTRKGSRNVQPVVGVSGATEKSRGVSIVSRINSQMQRVEAWR